MTEIRADYFAAMSTLRARLDLKRKSWMTRATALSLGVLLMSPPALADTQEYSQPARNDVPREVFWGDTHVHTSNSSDSYGLGNTSISPEEAYLFASGEVITAHNGMKVRLRRPLDFLAVSDHAEYLGVFRRIENNDPDLLATETGRRWRELQKTGNIYQLWTEFQGVLGGDVPLEVPDHTMISIWRSVGEVADRFNKPGQFTAFVAYEWTSIPSTASGSSNLHRNVLYREGAELTNLHTPFSSLDSLDPEDLWAHLASYERETGGSVLAIPHNGNLSGGLMFSPETLDGNPLTAAYAETRMRWEPIYEVTQVKGDGEANIVLSPNDEFADFETWNSWRGPTLDGVKTEGWIERKEAEYARSALKTGLAFDAELGANPFKFGMIGSTDSHTGLSTPVEGNFFGKFPHSQPMPSRTANEEWEGRWPSTAISAAGLAAVWARENTRAAIFDAMKRKEVYATTGPRIVLRFFGGWDYPADADLRPDYVDIGYIGGVPMGGDLTSAPEGEVPQFVIVAAKDPDSANLDRVQIIKGWLDADGELHEKVHDVVWSGERKPDPETGKLPPVGSTVDIANAAYTNTIGEPVLSVTWTDPDFDPAERSFYYVRVIEIPTPRWTAYDARFFNLKLPDEIKKVTQNRAYSSPIWYTP